MKSTNNFHLIVIHFLQRNGRFIMRNIVDFIGALSPLPQLNVASNKKRILIFNWRDTKHKYAGGAEVYIHEVAKRLVKDGHLVSLFCGNDGVCQKNETVDGIQVIRRGGFYFVYLWAFFYYLIQFRGRYDVIIDCENGIPFFTPLYTKKKIFCLVFHIHQEVFRRSLSKPLSFLALILENRLMPWVYKNIKFITISRSSKTEMKKIGLGSAGIEVIYPGINWQEVRVGIRSKTPLILYLGRLKYYKSLNILIRAAKKVLEKIPQAEFVIAGDGEEKNGLQKLAKRLGIENKITFTGKVSEEGKIKLYQRAWLFVNPSFMEGWGITSIEANAFGIPVIASNIPGLRDSVQNPHSGYIVPYGNINAFADCIYLLLKDKKIREYMSGKAIQWAKRFSWEKSAERFTRILKTL